MIKACENCVTAHQASHACSCDCHKHRWCPRCKRMHLETSAQVVEANIRREMRDLPLAEMEERLAKEIPFWIRYDAGEASIPEYIDALGGNLTKDLEHWEGYGITTALQLGEYLDHCARCDAMDPESVDHCIACEDELALRADHRRSEWSYSPLTEELRSRYLPLYAGDTHAAFGEIDTAFFALPKRLAASMHLIGDLDGTKLWVRRSVDNLYRPPSHTRYPRDGR